VSGARRLAILASAVLAAPFFLAAGVALAAQASGTISGTGSSPARSSLPLSGCTGVPASTSADGLASSQIADAQIIYDVSVSLNLPLQASVIAIATAMQESRLENIDYGTADSLGLFQQRPSQGWGAPAQIMNPVYAATAFYDALVKVPGWQQLPLTVAAQDVQHSGYPDAYAQWQQLATTLVEQLSSTASDCLTGNGLGVPASGTTHIPAGWSLPAGTPQAIQTTIAYALAQLGKPYIWGGTGPAGYDCSGLVMMAYQAAGIDLPRTTFQQVDSGTPVYSLSQLQPGDLLFTAGSDGTASDPGHVGLFIGDGLVEQAPETGEPIMLTPLAGYWQQNTVAMRRVASLRSPP
jgi:cell wall-associated NlpC family hydrolase